jgi:four helix bundle protein
MPAQNLIMRTFDFAVSVGKLIAQMPNNMQNRMYFAQLIRSSASVGANYRASQRARSCGDFINKLKIVEEEADESSYFLELILVFNPSHKEEIVLLINECGEILRIVVASIKTARENQRKKKKS